MVTRISTKVGDQERQISEDSDRSEAEPLNRIPEVRSIVECGRWNGDRESRRTGAGIGKLKIRSRNQVGSETALGDRGVVESSVCRDASIANIDHEGDRVGYGLR